jgi:hypothetical protein
MKVICPFCRRRFVVEDPRSLLANEFCNKCIDERMLTSGYKWSEEDDFQYISHSAGYGLFSSLNIRHQHKY